MKVQTSAKKTFSSNFFVATLKKNTKNYLKRTIRNNWNNPCPTKNKTDTSYVNTEFSL